MYLKKLHLLRQNNINEKDHLFTAIASNMNIFYIDTQVKLCNTHIFPCRLTFVYLDILFIKVPKLVSQHF